MRSLADWHELGVKRISGRILPGADMSAAIVMPARKLPHAFLVYDNYRTILRWNNSDFFAISVGALADEISRRVSMRACRS